MTTSSGLKLFTVFVIACIASGAGWAAFQWIKASQTGLGNGRKAMPTPVAVAKIKKGSITLTRTFSGTLEAQAKFDLAPKASGRLKRLYVDMSDEISRDQVVAELDNDEYVQEVAQAKADVAVSRANLMEAKNALIIANRELDRIKTLSNRGIKSESQLDTAKTGQLEKEARLEVARAQTLRAEATLETANIRLGYTKVKAEWSGDDDLRVVAERFVDEGDTVTGTTPLMSIVRLQPITGVIFITEKEYSRVEKGQAIQISTDALPDEFFHGKISRIAPVFKVATRQARIEMTIANKDRRLKPGMFIRATVMLNREEEAIIIPEQALTKRDDETGIFVVMEKDSAVRWQTVTVGIKNEGFVQVNGVDAGGYVVTLGQQLLANGSPIIIPEDNNQ